MKIALSFLAFFLLTNFSNRSYAGMIIEPSVGVESSTSKLTTLLGDAESKISGSQLGLRLGYKLVLVWAGLDYNMLTNGSVDGGKLDRSNLYLTAGVNVPILGRVWAGYGLMNNSTFTADNGTTTKYEGGSAYKVGLGFSFLPLVSLNLEYFAHDYGKLDGSELATGTKIVDTGTIISVSLPL